MASSIGITLEIDNTKYIGDIRKADAATKDFATNATNEAKKAGDAFNKLNNNANQLAAGFGKLKSVLLGAAFIGFARSAIQLADEIKDLSSATGIVIQDILNFRQAMELGGGSANDAGKALTFFYSKIDEAAQGSASAQEAFSRVGIGLKELATLSEQDILEKIVKRLAEMPASAERTALQAELLGKAFKGITIDESFLETLRQGNAESQQLAADIEKAAALNDAWAKTWDNLRLAFIQAFGPMLEGITQLLKDMPQLINLFKILGVVIVAAMTLSGIGSMITGLRAIAGGVSSIISLFGKAKRAKDAFITGSKAKEALAGAASFGAGIAAGAAVGTVLEMGGGDEYGKVENKATKSSDKQVSAGRKVVDAMKQQRDAILKVGDAYDVSTAKTLNKIQEEAKMVLMTENQKEAFKARAQVEQEAEDTIRKLQDERSKNNGKLSREIDAEIEKVKQRRDQVVTQLDEEIVKKQNVVRIDKERVQAMEAMFDIQNKVKDVQDQYLLDTLVGVERQLKQIEIQERKTMESALQRWEVENRNMPPDEFAARREAEYRRLNGIFQETVTKQQQVAKEGYAQSRTFESGWSKAFREYVDNATNAASAAQRVFQKATQGMEDLIVNFAKTGKFEFKSFMNSILEELLRSQVRQLMAQIFNLGGSSGRGGGGSLLGSVGNLLGFANGGIIPTNAPVLVGERGPELISGAAGRNVTPNEGLAGMGGTYVTYNINAVDAMSFKQMVAADPAFIYAVTQQGAKTVPQTRR